MPLLEAALDCIARDWYVFPCVPMSKKPMTAHGWHDASNDERQVRAWWAKTPNANIGIACNPSNLAVLDIDHGLREDKPLPAAIENMLDSTYVVRTGRRGTPENPELGLQIYFKGAIPDVGSWKEWGCSGQVKSLGGYVMAAGSIHPDSGLPYEVRNPVRSLAPTPEPVRTMRSEKIAAPDDFAEITSNRNVTLTSVAGRLRQAGLSAEAIEAALLQVNVERVRPELDGEEIRRIAENVAKYAIAEEIEVTIGKPQRDPSEWRTLFHSKDETDGTPDPEFLIRDFLQVESVTGIIGPARARKSIVTLNIIHSLLTGEKLFGKLEVPNKPERVVYLCPESGLKSLGRRVRNMGLAKFVGDSLFYTSMNSDPVTLNDPALREAVRGSVLFIDTAIRFFNGDENSSQDMKLFGEQCHGLIRDGVKAIVLLHHTAKSTEGNLTLESGRGSGDFGGFLTCCWGTTLDDYEDAYNSHSLMTCVKQRDFQADSFKVAPSGNQDDFFLQFVEGSTNAKIQVGTKAKAGKAKAIAFIRANLELTGEQIREALKEQGIDYGISSCRNMLRQFRGEQMVSTA